MANNAEYGRPHVAVISEIDARLLNAAPDLLAACEAAYVALPRAKHNDDTNAMLKAAILKAGWRV